MGRYRFDIRDRRGITLLEVVVCLVVVVVVAAILFPMIAHDHGPPLMMSDCQSNMKQIGSALKMYLSDWNDTYPTQRVWQRNGKLGAIRDHVKLTPSGTTNSDGSPKRFQYGVNWVEALFAYVESVSKDGRATWQCNASKEKYPTNSRTACVSYAFNRNLIEQPEQVIRGASNLMAVRELDRMVDSDLRPIYECRKPGRSPVSPFLTDFDVRFGKTNPKLHGTGSNILFADGHVKGFAKNYMPEHIDSKCWDNDTKQWFNFGPKSRVSEYMKRTIAVSP